MVQSNIYITRSVKFSSIHYIIKIKCVSIFCHKKKKKKKFLPIKIREELLQCESSSHFFIGKSLAVLTN